MYSLSGMAITSASVSSSSSLGLPVVGELGVVFGHRGSRHRSCRWHGVVGNGLGQLLHGCSSGLGGFMGHSAGTCCPLWLLAAAALGLAAVFSPAGLPFLLGGGGNHFRCGFFLARLDCCHFLSPHSTSTAPSAHPIRYGSSRVLIRGAIVSVRHGLTRKVVHNAQAWSVYP